MSVVTHTFDFGVIIFYNSLPQKKDEKRNRMAYVQTALIE